MKNSRGSLFIVSAPSGAGKTTLCKKLFETVEGIIFSVSYTTRRPRSGEVDGKDYSFVSEEVFLKMIDNAEFIEWAKVHGNYYGTSKNRVEEILADGKDVMLDIDVQGALKMRQVAGEGVYVFIMPPSMKALEERLKARMSNTEEDMKRRLLKAADEIKEYKSYNYVIINDNLDEALLRFKAIVLAGRSSRERIDPEWVERNFLNQGGV